MRIKITLVDEENGHVRIDCHPPIQQIIKAYRAGDMTPAMVYAVLAIKKMQGDSEHLETEQERLRQEEMVRSGLILPPTFSEQQGPTEVN